MSQSLVNESAGARTPLSGLVAALIMLLVTVFLSGLLSYLPQPVLAAVVLVAIAGLFKFDALKQLWRFSRGEFAVAVAALLGVLGTGLLRGVLIGAVLSLVLLLRRSSRPQTTELGRVPGTDYFADCIRRPENERVPEAFVFRTTGAILYFNVDYVRDRFFELLNDRREPTRLAVFFMGTIPVIDLAGAELLAELRHALHDRGVDLQLADVLSTVRDTLARAGLEEHFGALVANQPVAAVIRAWHDRQTGEDRSE
jgi:MFS superfamily sulfate permease-like transporter